VTLTARELHPEMSIVARADRGDSIQKLKRAGANKVLTPHMIGGKRMAQMILRPKVTDFIDLAMQGHDLQMEEFKVEPGSCLAGKDLIASNIRPDYNLIIIAIEKDSGRMVFNPQSDEIISEGDTLVLVGKRESFRRLQKECVGKF
jgi:voltage-gated potassium channel